MLLPDISNALEEKTQESIDTIHPNLCKVIILNDDHTTINFVIDILLNIFHKSHEEAVALTYEVHEKGSGVCGEYPYDIAMTKTHEAEKEARKNGFPLKLICEEL